jgi:magnesium transporter
MSRVCAPSKHLLRFLRAQDEALAGLTTQSLESSCSKVSSSATKGHTAIQPSTRTITTFSPSWSIATESSFFPFDAWRSHGSVRRPADAEASTTRSPTIHRLSPYQQSKRRLSSSPKARNSDEGFFGRLAGFKRTRPKEPLQPNDLPPITNFLDDNSSLGRVLKAEHQLKLRCTEFDDQGNVALANGEFKKSELIAKVL